MNGIITLLILIVGLWVFSYAYDKSNLGNKEHAEIIKTIVIDKKIEHDKIKLQREELFLRYQSQLPIEAKFKLLEEREE